MINIEQMVQNWYSGSSNIEDIGDYLQFGVTWSALFFVTAFGCLSAWQWLFVAGLTVIVMTIMKYAVNKISPDKYGKRPNGAPYSMPSGHTSGAFGGFFVFLLGFGFQWYILIPLVLAVFTAFSRVYAKKHHVRDTVVGALIPGVIAFVSTFIF